MAGVGGTQKGQSTGARDSAPDGREVGSRGGEDGVTAADVATCVACIDESAIDQANALYDGALTPTDPKNKDEKALNKCQAAIGKAATAFLAAKWTALTKCWNAVNAGKAVGDCPGADGKAA